MDAELMDVGLTLTNVISRPIDPAPSRDAAYETRADWSERYVSWFLAQAPGDDGVDDAHRYQVEFNSAVLDPQEYEHDTQAELALRQVH